MDQYAVSQTLGYANKVLFTDKECLVLTKEFQLPEDSQVVLRVLRRHNLYSFNLTEIQPARDITCLLAKASSEESTKWHRRMAHVNFKNINKLAKNGLVNRLPTMVLVTRPHNKTPYELLSGKVPNISHLKPFGCHVTILNTSDHLGKFEGKADEGFIVGYAAHSTQDPHIHAGTQDDSDSECDEQVIVVPSFPSNRFSGPKVREASEMVENTEEHLRQADMVPAGSIAPAASISADSIDPAASISAGPAEPFPTVIEPVHADDTSLPLGHSVGSFPSPSDLANSISSSSEMEDIYHHRSTGIFTSSSYDADFGGTITNLAPIVA
ncbi:putative ribonuclease H-like domain-containing protein, partial [Tanacetum coccineum]